MRGETITTENVINVVRGETTEYVIDVMRGGGGWG